MACPIVLLDGRKLFILNGFDCYRRPFNKPVREQVAWQEVPDGDKLKQAAHKHPDAIAFGYTRGRWYASA